MNKADSAYISNYLEGLGYSQTTSAEEADLIVLNSCVVRHSAEGKVFNKLSSLKGLKERAPNSKVALTGCLVDSKADELRKRFPYVDLLFKPQHWEALYQWTENQGLPFRKKTAPVHSGPSVSVFVPIIQGCDNFCSYCIVPYRRGREKSRPAEEIACEVEELVRRGTKEVTLLGQKVDSYGHDLPSKPDLADLLAQLNEIDGLWRIRFLTSHPRDMTQKLVQAVARLDKVCEHICLPVQAGDDQILEAMRRGYGVEQYRRLVEKRYALPSLAFP
jgi:tRNA-2-methylthio-N6-dimethylallyladenosine synthase